jgi:hypothetical protein
MMRILLVSAGVLLLSVYAIANAPSQADVDACNREAAAVVPSTNGLSNDGSASAVTRNGPSAGQPATEARSRGTDQQAPSTIGVTPDGSTDAAVKASPDSPVTATSRQAFAACLARHGYYKGYYRAPGG